MKNSNHEEADTRVVVHIVHALEQLWRLLVPETHEKLQS